MNVLPVPVDVLVGWEQQTYEVTEGRGLVNVCVILTGRTDRVVEISAETVNDTAIGKQKQ